MKKKLCKHKKLVDYSLICTPSFVRLYPTSETTTTGSFIHSENGKLCLKCQRRFPNK